ncbi:transposase [Dankookia sp. GCM10030260]|uniref:transposase n=1 Tax=Dankookia sp. GCM10030260 TaxID=3273390 RepID=UPI00362304A2
MVQQLGVAVGGRPGAGLARRLMLPVSRDTLLRVVRRLAPGKAGPVRVVGIDEWAWQRRQRYGTIICGLERHSIVELLPDRNQATVTAWLRAHPEAEVVTATARAASPVRSGRPCPRRSRSRTAGT